MPVQALQDLTPARAIVTPRGSSSGGGEVLPLEKYIRDLYRTHPIIAIVGPSGSGKTTAIRHLAHELAHLPISFVDAESSTLPVTTQCVVFALDHPPRHVIPSIVFDLAPWCESERVDYLLAKHPKQIRSIMKRLETCDCIDDLDGSPRLWAAVLDWMARKEEATDVRKFVRVMIDTVLEMFGDDADKVRKQLAVSTYREQPNYNGVPAALRHPFVGRLIVAECLKHSIGTTARNEDWWRLLLSPSVLVEAARAIRADPELVQRLAKQINLADEPSLSTSVSVMQLANPAYRPSRQIRKLSGVRAPDAHWAGVGLPDVDLTNADLRRADLSGAVLTNALARFSKCAGANFSSAHLVRANFESSDLREVSFRDAVLQQARLAEVVAHAADFNDANLRLADFARADLSGASFHHAMLESASLVHAKVDAADFTAAILNSAMMMEVDFREAILDRVSAARGCFSRTNFSGQSIAYLNAPNADFTNSDLTGLRLLEAILFGSDFRNAGLADIDWEGADLRDADFDNAAFHMGSSRSGLVESPIACEGSRTGFYTDESHETYKHAEEIRKANLCGADLTGAKVDKTDWYLVDLRGARYSTQQAMWFRKCGAILFDRK